MSEVDVWTVSIMLRTEGGGTRADASLQGRAVEVECSGSAGRPSDVTRSGMSRTSLCAEASSGLAWGLRPSFSRSDPARATQIPVTPSSRALPSAPAKVSPASSSRGAAFSCSASR